jgi:rRNA processing protein Gar1
MTMASGDVPAVGAEVLTADGDKLGTVKEVSGTCFKVNAPMRPDYWLGVDTIGSASSTGGAVHLNITKDRLGEAKEEGRHEHRGVHPHDTTVV